jgi:hypothetical protein
VQPPEILPGLPGEGPMPEQFTWPGKRTHSEGLVVRFFPRDGESWVGNFQCGTSRFSTVCVQPDPLRPAVVACGQLYVIDVRTRKMLRVSGGQIEYLAYVPETRSVVLANGLWFESVGPCEWKTQRLSWDGMRDIRIVGPRLLGQAWTPMNDNEQWAPFEVDLRDGSSRGGSYDGPR